MSFLSLQFKLIPNFFHTFAISPIILLFGVQPIQLITHCAAVVMYVCTVRIRPLSKVFLHFVTQISSQNLSPSIYNIGFLIISEVKRSTARDSRGYIIELKYHEKDVAASVPRGATSKLGFYVTKCRRCLSNPVMSLLQ